MNIYTVSRKLLDLAEKMKGDVRIMDIHISLDDNKDGYSLILNGYDQVFTFSFEDLEKSAEELYDQHIELDRTRKEKEENRKKRVEELVLTPDVKEYLSIKNSWD